MATERITQITVSIVGRPGSRRIMSEEIEKCVADKVKMLKDVTGIELVNTDVDHCVRVERPDVSKDIE